jgi:hypothetical protein
VPRLRVHAGVQMGWDLDKKVLMTYILKKEYNWPSMLMEVNYIYFSLSKVSQVFDVTKLKPI